jgi:hypothetical protein
MKRDVVGLVDDSDLDDDATVDRSRLVHVVVAVVDVVVMMDLVDDVVVAIHLRLLSSFSMKDLVPTPLEVEHGVVVNPAT